MEEILKKFDEKFPHPGKKPSDYSPEDWEEVMVGYGYYLQVRSFIEKNTKALRNQVLMEAIEALPKEVEVTEEMSKHGWGNTYNQGNTDGKNLCLQEVKEKLESLKS